MECRGSPGGSGRRRQGGHLSDGKDKERKKIDLAIVRREAKDLVWDHRRTLFIGLVLTFINRVVGFVLPANSKWLIDNVISEGRADLLLPIAGAAARGDDRSGRQQVRARAGRERSRAARHREHATTGSGSRAAPACGLLRLHEDGRAHLSDHDRRRGHPEPGRDGPRAARGRLRSPSYGCSC